MRALREQFHTLLIPACVQRRIITAVRSFNNYIHINLKCSKRKKLNNISRGSTNEKLPASRSRVVTVPEDLPLSTSERSVLSRGLTFIPLRRGADLVATRIDLERFFRRLRLRAYFHERPERPLMDPSPFAQFHNNISSWTPADGQLAALDRFIHECRESFDTLRPRPMRRFNLTKDERAALLRLKSRTDVVIKPADKGGAVVVWRRDLYIQEAQRQLSDAEAYTKLPTDHTPTIQSEVKTVVKSLISSNALPTEASALQVGEVRTSRFYLLPKIHKANTPGRPIVSACSCPTEHISAYLDGVLSPINMSLPTFVKDTTHALKIFNSFGFGDNAASRYIFTMDVTSLYTSIPHTDGLRALQFFLDRRQDPTPSTNTLLRLAELVLTSNTFEFAGDFYKQSSGVAMGTKMGPSYACLFVGYLEHEIFRHYSGVTPSLYRRYIDDIVGAASCSRQELDDFLGFVGSFHPAIKYTHTVSETSVPFLDIQLSIAGPGLRTSVYYKATDSHCYLSYTSSHPESTKAAIPYSQMLRIRRLCSDDADFRRQITSMAGFFSERGYPGDLVEAAAERVSQVSRSDSLLPGRRDGADRVPLVLTYHPHNVSVKNLVMKHWRILLEDQDTKPIFNERPLCAFRRDKNLKDQLVSSVLHANASRSAGTHPCGRRRCSMCAHIDTSTVVRGPHGRHLIVDSMTCISTSVVYALTCVSCRLIYVGQTGQRLADRFAQHLRSIRVDDGQPLSRHFNAPGHPGISSNLTVCGLAQCRGRDAGRFNLETRLIHKLGTLSPLGMNTRNDVRVI